MLLKELIPVYYTESHLTNRCIEITCINPYNMEILIVDEVSKKAIPRLTIDIANATPIYVSTNLITNKN